MSQSQGARLPQARFYPPHDTNAIDNVSGQTLALFDGRLTADLQLNVRAAAALGLFERLRGNAVGPPLDIGSDQTARERRWRLKLIQEIRRSAQRHIYSMRQPTLTVL
jgi:hypothetical protein